MSIANYITSSRFLLAPAIVVTYTLEAQLISVLLFVLASATDWFDGYAARSANQETKLGTLLDPLADKVLVVSILLMLAYSFPSQYFKTLVALIILRDIILSTLREWYALQDQSVKLAPTSMAKTKTALQMIAITFLLAAIPPYQALMLHVGVVLLTISAILSYLSLLDYMKKVFPVLTFSVKRQ